VVITSYRLLLFVSLLVVPGGALVLGARRGLPWRRYLVVLLAAAAGVLVGARLLNATASTDWYLDDPERLFHIGARGFSIFGGLSLGGLVGFAACRLLGLDALRAADALGPSLGVGIVLMRVGTFLAGSGYGTQTDLPWGVTFPEGSPAHLQQILEGGPFSALGGVQPVHPLQLYEAMAALAGAALAWHLLRRGLPDGVATASLIAWYAGWRLILHPLRAVMPGADVPDWFNPVMYAIVMVAAGGWAVTRVAMKRREEATTQPSSVIGR
jgi:phosphatidylglycerol:prolipoprotein diacylglycerol transferase